MRFMSGSKRFGSVKWFGSVSLVDFGRTLILGFSLQFMRADFIVFTLLFLGVL